MRVVKFRVWNYKSIIDSGDCFPAEKVTILAGKNEAGKSSLLEALADFNPDLPIRENAVPLEKQRSNQKPKIEIVFESTAEALIKIIDKLGLDLPGRQSFAASIGKSPELTITKSYPQTYEVSAGIFSEIQKIKPSDWSTIFAALSAVVSLAQTAAAAKKLGLPKLGYEIYTEKDSAAAVAEYETKISELIGALSEVDQNTIRSNIATLKSSLDENSRQKITLAERLRDALLKELPKFILFSSFEDVFPNEIPFGELKSNKWISDLEAMSDLDVDTIIGVNSTARKRHKHALGLQLNEDFKKFWTQDVSNLSLDWDSEKLQFWIQEGDEFYPPEVRSQGRRWHLAFYIRVAARSRDGVSSVILIDEPGLYLHATAQRDILKHLESASDNCQIFISTHSPYLIEPDKLERLRLIQRTISRGTFVENKVHAVSDKETLTPILTAIGLELNQGIVGSDKLDNVVVEGPADYFYLTAFKQVVDGANINFVSGGGAGNMPKIGTILQGWGARVIYLYDNDQAFKDAQRSIKKEWLTISKDCLLALNVDGAIEDIFSKSEFASILDVAPGEILEKNSLYLKSNKRDKVLPARHFLERMRSDTPPQLSAQTVVVIKSLFALLDEKFKDYKS